MSNHSKLLAGVASATLSLLPCFAQRSIPDVERVANWSAPLYWQRPTLAREAEAATTAAPEREKPHAVSGAQLGMAAVFVAVTPCRLVDTRGNGFTGSFGTPALAAGETRVIPVPSGSCSLPSTAVAYSFNIAVVPAGTTMRWLTAFPDGQTMPTLATLNDKAGLVTSNAAIVAAGNSGAVDIYVTDATNVIIDVNGYYAAERDSGDNVFVGRFAGRDIVPGQSTGLQNTAVGLYALSELTSGNGNVAIGSGALSSDISGGYNIAIGNNSGYFATGELNIYIGNSANLATNENNVTRIGESQTAAFISGIRGVTTGSANAVPVVIDSNGQLGTASSSRKVKRDIADMGDTTETLMSLRPVQFRYIAHGPDAPLQYGLIAEEVAEVAPELVARKADGEVETVFYDKVNAMLLNQVQTQQRQIESGDSERVQMRAQIEQMTGLISKLESRLVEIESRAK